MHELPLTLVLQPRQFKFVDLAYFEIRDQCIMCETLEISRTYIALVLVGETKDFLLFQFAG